MIILRCALYALLVLAVAPPRGEPRGLHEPAPSWGSRALASAAGLLALVSAYALPWSGVPLIPSSAWFPSALTALLLAPACDRGMGGFRARGGRVLAVVCVGGVLWGMRGFMLRIGTPGELYSLEGIGAVFRLESLAPMIYPAQGALFLGLVAAFSCAGLRGGTAGALVLFSCAGFLTTVFISPLLARASLALGAEQPWSLALQIAAALAVAAALGRALLLLQPRSGAARLVLAGTALLLTAAASVWMMRGTI